ncbi:hypothetical protein [Dyella sp.]|uniref:LysM peptidoglycan-binding domain-containing protein n=1 Tax=Dyella sp. TaxID=1869338 RepID=UPI002D7670BC|nr:hypothetical protein [Dyella sp.]HET7330953.1 hypothetical protein [Dyella sp.]
MIPSISGKKAPLKITACVPKSDPPAASGDPSKSISLLINPSELSLKRKTDFTKCTPMGDPATGRNFARMQPDTLTFNTTFDGTGVVPVPVDSTLPLEVEDQLEALNKVVYVYEGTDHQPNVVQIVWGTLLFNGRLTSFDIEYTLFRPSGAPVRAKVSMSFQGFKTKKEATLEANASSPDLSHAVIVQDGDTLPLLCYRIYGDSSYYIDVARFNGLHAFRALKPGATLHFPPLG